MLCPRSSSFLPSLDLPARVGNVNTRSGSVALDFFARFRNGESVGLPEQDGKLTIHTQRREGVWWQGGFVVYEVTGGRSLAARRPTTTKKG